MTVIDGITKDGLSKSEVGPHGSCSLRVRSNSVLSVQCNWIHVKCVGV